ncbi:LOG family protein [Chlamydiales bacterium]|nr:LOG family protein [Chlamydiales bacterium]
MKFHNKEIRYDLTTPDGVIKKLNQIKEGSIEALVVIEGIHPDFVGFQIDQENVIFNIKSTLAQLGVNGETKELLLDKERCLAEVLVELKAFGDVAKKMLSYLEVGSFIGKLFAKDDRRVVRDPFYISRMFGRSDRWGSPLLSLGGLHGSNDLILDKVDGRCVAYVTLLNEVIQYDKEIYGFLPTIAKGIKEGIPMRSLLALHQKMVKNEARHVVDGDILLVKTLPLHIRTVFANVVDELLTPDFHHTSARVLQPDTEASGDIYELYGNSVREVSDIPLEFYTLEPYREFVFFSDRDQLQSVIADPKVFFDAFKTAPEPIRDGAATFIVKGHQLLNLEGKNWITKDTKRHLFPGSVQSVRQALMVERYISQQPSYQFLKEMEDDVITSQGIILSRYFPTSLMKRMFLSDNVQRLLKGLYFCVPSRSTGSFFSHEDHAFLHDLEIFGIPVFWVDEATGQILKYCEKPDHESGMFVPLDKVDTFMKATLFGIYGSNLIEGVFDRDLKKLLEGLIEMRSHVDHPYLNSKTSIALVTGGGPGAMEVGNRVAKEVGILSCANIVDFRQKEDQHINEQIQNEYIEAKMTYRLDRLVERQAEFNLDFPLFLMGGIGTDFEFYLEQVRRKVGSVDITPILLFGEYDYWKEKITANFQRNLKSGTIKGSEWVSNCFYAVESAEESLKVYEAFFSGTLPIGPTGPTFREGFQKVK